MPVTSKMSAAVNVCGPYRERGTPCEPRLRVLPSPGRGRNRPCAGRGCSSVPLRDRRLLRCPNLPNARLDRGATRPGPCPRALRVTGSRIDTKFKPGFLAEFINKPSPGVVRSKGFFLARHTTRFRWRTQSGRRTCAHHAARALVGIDTPGALAQ